MISRNTLSHQPCGQITLSSRAAFSSMNFERMKFAVALPILLTLSQASHAGLFGPSNFEECVLDRMKGQDRSMIYVAREACTKAFPDKPMERYLDDEKIKSTWCESTKSKQIICITEQPKNYEITKVEADFYIDKCENIRDKKPVTIKAEKSLFSSKFEFETPPALYQCVTRTYFGFVE